MKGYTWLLKKQGDGMYCTYLAQDCNKWKALMNIEINLWVKKNYGI
jgi:hypothetical protein